MDFLHRIFPWWTPSRRVLKKFNSYICVHLYGPLNLNARQLDYFTTIRYQCGRSHPLGACAEDEQATLSLTQTGRRITERLYRRKPKPAEKLLIGNNICTHTIINLLVCDKLMQTDLTLV